MRQPATIIIPFRSMVEGKSRLSPVLSQREREELNRRMLEGVIAAALEVEQHPQVLIVSPDETTLHEVRMIDPRLETLVQDPKMDGLNGALEQATKAAIEAGSRVVVVVPADLPLIRGSDIANLLRRDAPVGRSLWSRAGAHVAAWTEIVSSGRHRPPTFSDRPCGSQEGLVGDDRASCC